MTSGAPEDDMEHTHMGASSAIPPEVSGGRHMQEPAGEDLVSVRLGTEELLAFLAMLGCIGVNGLDETYLESLSDDELRDAMDRGEASLQERGLIAADDDGGLQLSDVLTALVGCSIVPDASLRLVHWQEGKRTVEAYYDAIPELVVEHSVAEDGSHRFTRLPDAQALRTLAGAHWGGLTRDGIAVREQQYELPSVVLAQCLESCVAGDPERAIRLLENSGCGTDAAREIAAGFASGECWIGMVASRLRGSMAPPVEGAMVVAAGGSHWLARTRADDPDVTVVRAASGAGCLDALSSLLAPLEAVTAPAAAGAEGGGDG
jgi:hypothetical protein